MKEIDFYAALAWADQLYGNIYIAYYSSLVDLVFKLKEPREDYHRIIDPDHSRGYKWWT